jgi:hypothetical protein
MRLKFPKCVSVDTSTGELILECPENLVVDVMDRGIPGVIGPTFDLDLGKIITEIIKKQLDARNCNWSKDVPKIREWVPERSSGYDGYRNQQTGEWIYASEYDKRYRS